MIACSIPFFTGCVGASKTAQGAAVGGGLGAATGAIIGSQTGKAGPGALIGGAVGAGLGGLIGNEEDRRDKQVSEQRAASARMISTDEIVRLTQSGTKEDVIINQIRTTGATFRLTTDDLVMLQQNNVPPTVIKEMQSRRPEMVGQPRYPGPRVVHESVYVVSPPPPVYVAPPPPGFQVGVGISR